MRIGIDFDNTVVSYDEAFHQAAVRELGLGPETPAVKDAVRDALGRAGRREDWTRLQGRVYGPLMEQAQAFPGAREFLAGCRALGVEVRIISHRTRRPCLGPAYDLHEAARLWLARSGLLDAGGLGPADVFLEETREGKLARIAEQGCGWFIDDLPELLCEPGFPRGVGRILFDPSRTHESPFASAGSWAEAEALTLGLRGLLLSAGLGEAGGLSPVPGSANNRLFQVESNGGRRSFLKAYFSHPRDGRDRAGTEAAFSRFAWGRGLRQLPRLLAFDPPRRLSLFEAAAGRRVEPGEAAGLLPQALEFFREINAHRRAPEAAKLPPASEACFCAEEHASLVESRVRALRGASDARVRAFVETELLPAFDRARRAAPPGALAPGERCLSPSDFGFHNALLGPGGRLTFLDFEYAGWDDPAKTLCDFFEQPAVPAPEEAWPDFSAGVASALGGPAGLPERARRLRPLYRVKWACILLNDFLPAAGERRRFALGGANLEERLDAQLEKARAKLRGENG
jgi:hypothetical protein